MVFLLQLNAVVASQLVIHPCQSLKFYVERKPLLWEMIELWYEALQVSHLVHGRFLLGFSFIP